MCCRNCGNEHFGFSPSAPRLGNQRHWYVQPRLYDWTGIVSRWSVSSYSFIHQVIIITGLNKLYNIIVCSRPEDGLRCGQGVTPPLKLKLKLKLLTWRPHNMKPQFKTNLLCDILRLFLWKPLLTWKPVPGRYLYSNTVVV